MTDAWLWAIAAFGVVVCPRIKASIYHLKFNMYWRYKNA